MCQHQFYKNPHYVPLDEIDRMGDRLAAEYIIHTDTWTDTNMSIYCIADRCADAAKSHDIEQKTFQRQAYAHYSQYVLGGIG
jgi:hypothetical protein